MPYEKIISLFGKISIFLLLLGVGVLSSKLLLKDPPIWPDETYFVNMAENYNKTGHLSVSLYGTGVYEKLDIRSYSYPPVYIYTLASWIKVFGSSIVAVRVLSVVIAVASLVLFFGLCYVLTKSMLSSLVATLALELAPPFSIGSHIARMEILVLFFLLASISQIFIFGTKKTSSVAITTFFAVCAFLTHPIGILALGFVFVTIIGSQQRLKPTCFRIAIFFAVVGIGMVWWLWQMHDHLDIFIAQTSQLLSYKIAREPIINLLFKNDLSWRIVLLIYLFLGSAGSVLGILQKNRILLFCGIGTFLTILATVFGIDQWYFLFLPVFPILLLIVDRKRFTYIPLMILLLIHGNSSIRATFQSFETKENYFSFSEGVQKEIPLGKKVVISSIPDPYFVLRKRPDLTLYHMPTFVTEKELTNYLSDVDVVVYNYALNSTVLPYLVAHTAKKITVLQENGYQADVIFLKH